MPGLTIAKALIARPDGFVLVRPPEAPRAPFDFLSTAVREHEDIRPAIKRELRSTLGIEPVGSPSLWAGDYVDSAIRDADPVHIHLFGVNVATAAEIGRSVVTDLLYVPKDLGLIDKMAESGNPDEQISHFAHAALRTYVKSGIVNIPGEHQWA